MFVETAGQPVGSGDESHSGEAGFVLPAMIVLLMVLAALAIAITMRARAAIALAGSTRDRLVLDATADGVVRLTSLWLAFEARGQAPATGLPLDGRPIRCQLGQGRTLTMTVQDQGGLVDLNKAPRALMEEVARRLGAEAREASAFAAQVIDFRDADDVPEPNGGAERAQYRAERLPYGPRNTPFASADEIAQLPAVKPGLFETLRPAFTIHNGHSGYDARRMNWRLTSVLPADLQALPGLSESARPSDAARFEIAVTVEASSKARSIRSAIVRLDDATRPGGAVLSWRSPARWSGGIGSDGHPACARLIAAFGEGL